MLVDYGYYGRNLAGFITNAMSTDFQDRLRSMDSEDQDKPSALCRFMMDMYTREYSGRKFKNQFDNFAMTSEHTYNTYLSDLLIKFAQAEPLLSRNWDGDSVERVILQYHNGMKAGKNNEMRDFFTKKFIDDMSNARKWSKRELEAQIMDAMAFRDGLRQAMKPLEGTDGPLEPSKRKSQVRRQTGRVANVNEESDEFDDDAEISEQVSQIGGPVQFHDMTEWVTCDQWAPTSVCRVQPDDTCRNCGDLGHWAVECPQPRKDIPGRFYQRRYSPRNRNFLQRRPVNRQPQQPQGAIAAPNDQQTPSSGPIHASTGTTQPVAPAKPLKIKDRGEARRHLDALAQLMASSTDDPKNE